MDASDAGFRFWAATVPKNGKVTPKLEKDELLHLNTVALGQQAQAGRTTLFIESDGKKGQLCTLVANKVENATFEMILTTKPVLHAKGPNPLHVCGYIQPIMSGPDMMDELPEGMMEGLYANNAAAGEEDEDEAMPKSPVADSADSEDESPAAKDESSSPQKSAAKSVNGSKKRKIAEVESTEEKAGQKKKNKRKKKKKNKETTTPAAAPEEAKEESDKETQTTPKSDTSGKKKSAATPDSDTTTPKKKKKKKSKKKNAGKGVTYRVIKEGKTDSPPAKKGTKITVKYIGQLATNGKTFDKDLKQGLTATVGAGDLIPGMDAGLVGMKLNEKRKIEVPSAQAYGENGANNGEIPPNSDLVFTVQRVK